MKTATRIAELRECITGWRQRGDSISLVPTMGNLHAGHLHLVALARSNAARTVASIFVNPLQFGAGEDYEKYPRTPEEDAHTLAGSGVDLLFAPGVEEIYPGGRERAIRVQVPGLSDILCGRNRPGHFSGVATVVAKLLNLVQPDYAVFGEKDYQQLTIIRRVVQDLCLPVTIISGTTQREADGLAISSRNRYLTPEERARAPQLYAALREAAARISEGTPDYRAIESAGLAALERAGLRPDYFEIRTVGELEPPGRDSKDLVVLAAAWLGKARLIDNVAVEVPV